MIKGMTGYGQSQLKAGKVKALIEIKSVNHRYLDVNYFLPIGFGSVENKMRLLIQKMLNRGRVTVSMKITHKEATRAILNREVARAHMKNINKLKREFGIKGMLSLSDLASLPGVLETKETMVGPEDIKGALDVAFNCALFGLMQMRKREGKSLAADINEQLRRMGMQVKKIQRTAKSILQEQKKTMTAEEFRAVQRGSDVNEEVTRLIHYIDEIKPLLKSTISVGKKIDFIAQEMQRETNTIGSKLQDKIVSNAVISLKSKIEKIREQAQNIE
jgi:uncharacterized protein (TIGR00255 family)